MTIVPALSTAEDCWKKRYTNGICKKAQTSCVKSIIAGVVGFFRDLGSFLCLNETDQLSWAAKSGVCPCTKLENSYKTDWLVQSKVSQFDISIKIGQSQFWSQIFSMNFLIKFKSGNFSRGTKCPPHQIWVWQFLCPPPHQIREWQFFQWKKASTSSSN